MKNIALKYRLTLIGVAIGAAGGFIYWQQVGCVDGHCLITSSPVRSSLYGALMGGLFLNMFQKDKNKTNKTQNGTDTYNTEQ